jgi:hypothetical protein
VGVAQQLLPRGMQRELLDFVNFVAALEQATRGLMPEIVKM